MVEETIIKSPEVSFCCSAIEFFQNEVIITGYTVGMILMVRDKSNNIKYPNVDTWKMEEVLKNIRDECMDRLLVPKNMKQINIKKEGRNLIIKSNELFLSLPEKRVVLLDCKNFMMDEIAALFLKNISKKLSNKNIGMKISFGKPVGEVEIWL